MLYFIRHGKTDNNLKRLLSGRYDIPLNEEGMEQARKEALEMKDLHLDIIFCSPLTRTKQTCEEINKYHNVPVIYEECLVERCFGKYENKTIKKMKPEKYWNYFKDENNKGIERLSEVFGRVYAFLDKIKEEYKDKDILIIGHNDIGRALYCYFNGLPSDGNVYPFRSENATVVSYNFDK